MHSLEISVCLAILLGCGAAPNLYGADSCGCIRPRHAAEVTSGDACIFSGTVISTRRRNITLEFERDTIRYREVVLTFVVDSIHRGETGDTLTVLQRFGYDPCDARPRRFAFGQRWLLSVRPYYSSTDTMYNNRCCLLERLKE